MEPQIFEIAVSTSGRAGEAAMDLLATIGNSPSMSEKAPGEREFLESIELHGKLPATANVFGKLDAALAVGDEALAPTYGISGEHEDDAFASGLVAGIGWLAIAEAFPVVMAKYVARCQGADPIAKSRVQREIFPCGICVVSERNLDRYVLPPPIMGTLETDPVHCGLNRGQRRLH